MCRQDLDGPDPALVQLFIFRPRKRKDLWQIHFIDHRHIPLHRHQGPMLNPGNGKDPFSQFHHPPPFPRPRTIPLNGSTGNLAMPYGRNISSARTCQNDGSGASPAYTVQLPGHPRFRYRTRSTAPARTAQQTTGTIPTAQWPGSPGTAHGCP